MSTYGIDRLREQVGEVIAKHEAARDVGVFSKYADDPGGFFCDVLRCELWEKQLLMAELVRDHRRVVTLSANGIGKDFLCARLALWWIYARRGFVILTGPTERQVKHILMREVRRAYAKAPELPGELYSLELRVDEESGLIAFTSDNADRLTGFHHPHLLICITEGQGVAEDAYEAFQACATGPANRVFVYGNPTKPTGPFYRVAHSDNWKKLKIRADEHPNVISGREEIPGAVSREFIEGIAEEYGASSSIYRARVLAEFPTESIEGLISRAWLRAAFERHVAAGRGDGPRRDDSHLVPSPIMGLDIARFGPDRTGRSTIQGPIVREITTWGGASITETVDRVIAHGLAVQERDIWNRRPTVWVDEPGLGGGAIDVLKQRGYPTRGFNGSERASDPSRWLNTRAMAFWHFRTELEADNVTLPPDKLLLEEALSVEWTIAQNGAIQIVGKDLIRRQLGRSPDRLDSVVIALCASMGAIRGPIVRSMKVRI